MKCRQENENLVATVNYNKIANKKLEMKLLEEKVSGLDLLLEFRSVELEVQKLQTVNHLLKGNGRTVNCCGREKGSSSNRRVLIK